MIKYISGVVLLGLLLFVPAGTLAWKQGWMLMGVLFIPMFLAGLVMMKKSPELLRKRLNMREQETEQKEVIALSGILFAAVFIVAGLNYRFGWLVLSETVSWLAVILFLTAYALYAEVLRENEYLSRTVEVQEGQKVIDTGLYGVVRHPMYMTTLFLFLSMPLILGSLPSFVLMLGYIPIIAKRIRNEEKVLAEGLEGHADYQKRVKYKVIPYIW